MKSNEHKKMALRFSLILMVILLSPVSLAFSETLEDAWLEALNENRGYRATQQQAKAAAGTVRAAKALRWGKVDLSAGFTKLDNEQILDGTLLGMDVQVPLFEEESFSYGAMATVPLYTGGRVQQGIEAAESLYAASLGQVNVHEQGLKMKVAEAYVTVLRVERILRQAESHVKNLEAHQHDVEGLYEQGMVIVSDKLSVQVALADACQRELQARNGLDLARAAYNNLLMRPLESHVSLEEIQPIYELPAGSLEEMTALALENRKEMEVLENSTSALKHKVKAIQGEKLPQVGVAGGYLYQENEYQVNEGNWMVGIEVKMNLFDGGEKKHKEQVVNSQARVLQNRLFETRSLITLQVRQAWLDRVETEKRTKVTEDAVVLAEENLKVVRDRYVNGFTSHTEVLDAETLRMNSQTNAAHAFYDWTLADLRLRCSLGRL